MSNFGLLRGRCTVEGVFTIRGCSLHSSCFWLCWFGSFLNFPKTFYSYPKLLLDLSDFIVRRQVEVSSWFCALRCSATYNQTKLDKQTPNPMLIFPCACLVAVWKTLKSIWPFLSSLLLRHQVNGLDDTSYTCSSCSMTLLRFFTEVLSKTFNCTSKSLLLCYKLPFTPKASTEYSFGRV